MKDSLLLEKLNGYDNSEISKIIDRHIRGKNAQRNREILKCRIIDGMCYEPLSEKFDLSVRQTQNIVYNGMNKLLFVI